MPRMREKQIIKGRRKQERGGGDFHYVVARAILIAFALFSISCFCFYRGGHPYVCPRPRGKRNIKRGNTPRADFIPSSISHPPSFKASRMSKVDACGSICRQTTQRRRILFLQDFAHFHCIAGYTHQFRPNICSMHSWQP